MPRGPGMSTLSPGWGGPGGHPGALSADAEPPGSDGLCSRGSPSWGSSGHSPVSTLGVFPVIEDHRNHALQKDCLPSLIRFPCSEHQVGTCPRYPAALVRGHRQLILCALWNTTSEGAQAFKEHHVWCSIWYLSLERHTIIISRASALQFLKCQRTIGRIQRRLNKVTRRGIHGTGLLCLACPGSRVAPSLVRLTRDRLHLDQWCLVLPVSAFTC